MFENFISLGWYCGTAASMSKYGIRSQSGPFDWYFSNFPGVLACMENDFSDFLDKNNLVMLEDRPGEFLDTKHEFHYNHEVTTSFEEDFDGICDKYARRINKFREMIKHKTCFIRAVRHREELRYIRDNPCMIENIVKKSNPANEIIYVVSSKAVTCEKLEFPFFTVDCIYDGASRKRLRGLFDKNEGLQGYCYKNFDENIRYRNLYFDMWKENQRLDYKAAKYDLMNKIEETDLAAQIVSQGIIIYEAGIVGKYLFQKVKSVCRVWCFVDSYARETLYEDVPIISFHDFIRGEYPDIPIIVTSYIYRDVRTMLNEAGKSNVLSIDDFLHQRERQLCLLSGGKI